MATFDACPSSSPLTGLIDPALIEPVGGRTLSGVLGGSETLPVGSIPYADPLYGSPSPGPATIGLRIDASLKIDGSGALGIAGAPTPGAHAATHEPGGSDILDPAAFDGLIAPPIATDAVLGGVMAGDGTSVALDGTLTLALATNAGLTISASALQINTGTGVTLVTNQLELDIATSLALGGVIASTGLAVDGFGNLALDVAPVTGTTLANSYVVWDSSPSAGSPLAGLRLSGAFEYLKQIPYSQLPLARYGSPASGSPSPQLGVVRVYGPDLGLTLTGGLLSLTTPISTNNLPKATAAGGLGLVSIPFLGTSGLKIVNDTTGELGLWADLTSDTITTSVFGTSVKANRFLPMTGTGYPNSPDGGGSPAVGEDGWLTGTVRFIDDLGAPAIQTGNQRIRYGSQFSSPSPAAWLYNADLDDLLTYGEVAHLIAAGVAGFAATTPGRPVQAEPGAGTGSIAALSAGDRFLTSTDSTINPGGDWAAHNAEFAVWTESAPDTFSWVFTTPTTSTWFVDESTGDTWFVVVGGSPIRDAFRYRIRNEAAASTGVTGPVRVPLSSGLIMDGEALRLTLADDLGVSTGLKLVTRARTNALSIDLAHQGVLELSTSGQLQIAASSITGGLLAGTSVALSHILADQVIGGTRDFIETQYDALSVRLVGDTEDFRTTGAPVGTATTILIHTVDGIAIAEESINTDALADEAVAYSKLLLSSTAGLESDGQDKIQIKIATGGGLTRASGGLAVNIHNVVDDATLALDSSTGGLRLKTGSITSAYLAAGFGISASQITLAAPVHSSSGSLSICYQSPLILAGSPGCLTVGPGLIVSPYIGSGAVSYSKLALASPSGLVSIGGLTQVDIAAGFAFSGNQLIVSEVPATALVLDAASALYEASPESPGLPSGLSIRLSSPLTQTGNTLSLANAGVQLEHLAQWRVRPNAAASGLEQGSALLDSPTSSWATSPGYLGVSTTGARVATRTRSDHDYLAAAGQGQGTIEPYALTLAEVGGTPSGSVYQNRLAPTLNSIGLQHMALGNAVLAPTDADRLPTGFGSYKALLQNGKLSASPVTARGWSVVDLSDDLIAVRVGPGLTISTSGHVQPFEVGASQLLISAEVDNTGTPGMSGHPFVSYDDSPGRLDTLALAYDPGVFTASAAYGLELLPGYRTEFTGSAVPALAGGYYAFVLSPGTSTLGHGLIQDSVDVHVNGLRIERPFYAVTSPAQVAKQVVINYSASPGPNIAYTLSQSTSTESLDRIVIQYRTRPVA